jgi:Sec-independent protein translocase protein TatA
MAVMARETWTDERLDDLGGDMNRHFGETKTEIRQLRADMDKGFGEVKGEIKGETKGLRAEMNARFAQVESRLDSHQRTMVLGFASIVASIVATNL